MEKNEYILLFKKFLHKRTTPEETELLNRWLKHESAFPAYLDEQWEEASDEIDPAIRQRLLEQIKARTQMPLAGTLDTRKKPRMHPSLKWIAQVAAVLLLLLLTGGGVYFYMKSGMISSDMIVRVEKGQKAHLTLPDGSKVWMNSDTRLTYGKRFNRRERVLNLVGEAYFEVAPDKNRPFVVQVNGIAVKALGTSFNVKSYTNENRIVAVLMTGLVEISSGSERLILKPNEMLAYDKSTHEMVKYPVPDAADYSEWKDNKLHFHSETFENIALSLERYYNVRIVFESGALKKYRFTGTPGNSSLESILQILSLTSPLSYEVTDSMIVLRENISEKKWYEKALQKKGGSR